MTTVSFLGGSEAASTGSTGRIELPDRRTASRAPQTPSARVAARPAQGPVAGSGANACTAGSRACTGRGATGGAVGSRACTGTFATPFWWWRRGPWGAPASRRRLHPPPKRRRSRIALWRGVEEAASGCTCRELLYKPVVIACGHMSCFWCVHQAMHDARESHCAICRQPYNHFPGICQLLHHLLLKLEPVEYEKREKEVLELENSMDTYSPQNIEFLNSKGNNYDGDNKLEDGKTRFPGQVSVDDNTMDERSKKVKLEDVSCPLCKELLYQPAVLNCGHVYCMSCLPSLGDEALKCQVCGGLHPGSYPNICLDLDHFLEEYFPAEHESRRKKLQSENTQCNPEGSSSSTSCSKDEMDKVSKRGTYGQQNLDLSNVHAGIGCDSCGAYPIRGERYKCKDCTEAIGFDLCGECYNTRSKLPGRFNQQHTSDHKMELDNSSLYDAFLRFQGIPAEGLQQLIVEEAFIGPGGIVHIIGDDHEMGYSDEDEE